VLTNDRHPENISNFQALPRELRDMIYTYIVGKYRKLPLPIYESIMSVQIEEMKEIENKDTLGWEGSLRHDPARNRKRNTEAHMSLSQKLYLRDESIDHARNDSIYISHKHKKGPATQNLVVNLLSINKQINQEAIEILYKQNNLHFRTIGRRPTDTNRRTLPSLRMHFDPLRLTKLRLEYACTKEYRLRDISFDGLQNMHSLRTLRLVVSLPAKPGRRRSATWNKRYEKWPHGSFSFWTMMYSFTVSLPISVQKVEYGPEDLPPHLDISELPAFKVKHQALGYGGNAVKRRRGSRVHCVPGTYMQCIHEEIKTFLSSEAGLTAPVVRRADVVSVEVLPDCDWGEENLRIWDIAHIARS
jgi:hypothetical protein